MINQRRRSFHLIASVSALLLAACNGEPAGERPTTIVIGESTEPGTLFPPATGEVVETAIGAQIFLRLADMGDELNTVGDAGFIPRLAQSWERVDSLTWLFYLNPAAEWHDGVSVTAHDVEFTFDLYRDSLVASATATSIPSVDRVSAVDSHTVRITFSRSYSEQFYDATYHVYILPSHLLEGVSRSDVRSHPFARNPVGNGPYRFVNWEAGSSIELAAVEDHFLDEPDIDRQIWRFISSSTPVINQLLTGEVDFVRTLPPDAIEMAIDEPTITTLTYGTSGYGYLSFNMRNPNDLSQGHPIFSDRAVRSAIATAIDRHEIVEAVLGGYAAVPDGPATRILGIWREAPRVAADQTEARRLLAESGWMDTDGDGVLDKDGSPLEFGLLLPSSSTPRRGIGVILQERLRSIGMEVHVVEVENTTLVEYAAAGNFDAMLGFWRQDPSPATIRESWTGSDPGSLNYSRYSSPEFDRLVDAAIEETDPESAREKWWDAFDLINSDAVAIWLYNPTHVAAATARVSNVRLNPVQWWAHLREFRIADGN